MEKPDEKRPNYLERTVSEIHKLVDEAENRRQLKATLTEWITEKLRESFKNGLDTGAKRQSKNR